MDQKEFDKLIQRLNTVRVTRSDAIRGLAAGAGAALTRSVLVTDEAKAANGGKGKAKGKEKVTICHKGQTITVARPAVQAHLNHGDSLGACYGG